MSILKRVISLLLCIVMLTSVLASCDTDDSHNHETGESTTEQPQGSESDHTHTDTKQPEETTDGIQPHTHTPATAVTEKFVDSSCTATGSYDEVIYCSECQEEISRTQKTVDKKPHDHSQKVTTAEYLKAEATCTDSAVYYYSCSCGDKGTASFREGDPSEHTYNQKVVADKYLKSSADCNNAAVYYYSCVCGVKGTTTFTDGEANGHGYSSTWENNATHHWHKATCEHTTEISGEEAHDYGTDNVCDTCGYDRTVSVSGVELNFSSLALTVDDVKTLIATITPNNATNQNVTWTTSNASIVTVDTNGKITAVGVGTATITVTTADGNKTAQCTVVVSAKVCPHTTTRTERENEVDSTCKVTGTYDEVVYCSTCGDELSRTEKIIPKKTTHTGGTPVHENIVDSTCKDTGSYDEVVYCSICGVELSRVEKTIEKKTTHTANSAVQENIVDSTCKEVGSYDEVIYCSVCNKEISRTEKTIEKKTTHTESEAVQENFVDSTFEAKGSYDEVVYCSVCGKELERTTIIIPEKKHTPAEAVIENKIDSTCKEEGTYDEVVYCSECGDELSRVQKTIEKKTVHTEDEAVTENLIDSTCKDEGSYDEVIYCSVCDVEIRRTEKTIAKKDTHTEGETVTENYVDSTFEEKGSYDEVVYCTVCGKELSRTTISIPEKHHTPAEMVIENRVEPTCKTEGSYDEVVYCSVCGEELSRVTKTIAKKNTHTEGSAVEENRVEADCKNEGSYDTVIYCTICDKELSRTENTIDKKPHTNSTPVVENKIDSTCKAEGSYDEVVYCAVCDDELSRVEKTIEKKTTHTEGSAVIENYVDSTCKVEGKYDEVIYCSECDKELSRTEKAVAKKTTHTEGAVVTENFADSTCKIEGSYDEVIYCSVCDKELKRDTKKIAKKNTHTEGEAITENYVDSSCFETGSYDIVVYCSVCDKELSRVEHTIGKKSHTQSSPVQENFVDSSCTATGSYDEVVYCSECQEEISRVSNTIDKKAHIYNKEVATETYLKSDATCTEKAVYYYSCVCGEKGTTATFTSGSSLGHSYASAWEKNDTHHWHKATCEHTSEVSAKAEHNYGSDLICDTCGYSAVVDVTSLTLNKTDSSIQVGDVEYLIATLLPTNATDKTINWTSTNASVAIVNNGTVVGVGVGDAIIIATTPNGKVAMCNVHVSEKIYYADSITLNTSSAELAIGKSITLIATITPSNTTDKTVTWSTSDVSVATVNNGVVTAVGVGTVTITATTSNGKTATCIITVKIIPVTDIVLDQTIAYVDVAEQTTLLATVIPDDATFTDLIWSSSDETVAIVENGVVTGVKEGTVTITVSSKDGSISKTCQIVVETNLLNFVKSGDGYAFDGVKIPVETLVIPDTYKGKPVAWINTGAFSKNCDNLKELVIGKNISSLPNGILKPLQKLEKLTIANYSGNHFGDLFGAVTVSFDGGLDTFLPERTQKGTYSGSSVAGGAIYMIPATNTDWYLNSSLGVWFEHNGDTYLLESYFIPRSSVVSWQTDYRGYEPFSVPKRVQMTAYCVPQSLVTVNITGEVSCSFSNCQFDRVKESSLSLKNTENVCAGKTANIQFSVNGKIIGDSILDFISSNDAQKLTTVGTHEITVIYDVFTKIFSVTIVDHITSNAVTENYVDSTCTENGSYDEVVYCSMCNGELSRVNHTINKKGHSPADAVTENLIDFTCTETYDKVIYCSICHEEMDRTPYVINKQSHIENAPVSENIIDSTCKVEGSYHEVIYCSICETELSRTVRTLDKKEHTTADPIIENYIESTCIAEGAYDSVVYCKECLSYEISREHIIIEKYHHIKDGVCTGCGMLESSEGLIFVLNDDGEGYTVTGIGSCTDTDIKIGLYNNLPVTNIGDKAFQNAMEIISVTISNKVTNIGNNAFYNCESLVSITIPSSVVDIGESAFAWCDGLSSVTIENGTNTIGKNAFYHCSSLKSIIIPNSVGSIGDTAFDECSSLESAIIGNSVTSIGNYAFRYCTNLFSVTIGINVNSIGNYAFLGCYKLVEVINYSTLNITVGSYSNGYIAYYAKEIHCHSSKVVSINDYVFYTYNNVNYLIGYVGTDTNLVLPKSYNNASYEIGRYAFFENKNLVSVIISDGVTHIGEYSFNTCSSLTKVIIGNGVVSIGRIAFHNCNQLTEVYYSGVEDEWNNISINSYGNDKLINATYYYYSEATPTAEGNYWHYADGIPTKW